MAYAHRKLANVMHLCTFLRLEENHSKFFVICCRRGVKRVKVLTVDATASVERMLDRHRPSLVALLHAMHGIFLDRLCFFLYQRTKNERNARDEWRARIVTTKFVRPKVVGSRVSQAIPLVCAESFSKYCLYQVYKKLVAVTQ